MLLAVRGESAVVVRLASEEERVEVLVRVLRCAAVGWVESSMRQRTRRRMERSDDVHHRVGEEAAAVIFECDRAAMGSE